MINPIDMTTLYFLIVAGTLLANCITVVLIILLLDDGLRRLRNAFITFMGGAD